MTRKADESSGSDRWWQPARHAERRLLLLERNRIQARIRAWLAEAGFTEVDPAGLQVSPGNEAHLHAFRTSAIGDEGAAEGEKVGLTRRIFQVTGNALADSGDLFASVGAGARASVANYKVARETEYQRQMERTKARLRLMLEQ